MRNEEQSLGRLSKRARAVLEALFRLGEASASDVLREVDELPSYSAARSVLKGLFEKGLIKRREREFKYLYRPAVPRRAASRSALAHLLDTFFEGSPEQTMRSLVDLSKERGAEVDWKELERLIREARKEGR